MLTRWLAVLCLLAAGLTAAAAEEFRTPSITAVRVEWRAVVDQLRTEIGTRPAIASRFTFAGQRRVPAWDPRATPALVQLNAINASLFAGIGRSPVPVLLPFDTAGYLEDQADGTLLPLSRYQADFRPADLFHAGPAGYDAVFSLQPGAGWLADLRQAGRSADHRLDPHLRPRRSARRQGRAGQGAGGAVPRHAPLHP